MDVRDVPIRESFSFLGFTSAERQSWDIGGHDPEQLDDFPCAATH